MDGEWLQVVSKSFTREAIYDQKPEFWGNFQSKKIWEMNIPGKGNSDGEDCEGQAGRRVWGPR